VLRKRVDKIAKKDHVLALIFKKKLLEIIKQDETTIDAYKNLRSPKNEYKRIHLTNQAIPLFHVDKRAKHIVFVDILPRDKAYR